LLGITHSTSTDSHQIGIVNAGTYAVFFSVSGTESNQFTIFVGASPAALAAPEASTVYGCGAGTQQNNGMAILTLSAGSVLTLVNYLSASAIGFANEIGGTIQTVTASVLIERLA
jgi:threonine aldolase